VDAALIIQGDMNRGARGKAFAVASTYGRLVYALNEPRKGFYCLVCSTEGIDAISWRSNPLSIRIYSNRVYYKWEFCDYLL
jgi:hypothetical protein